MRRLAQGLLDRDLSRDRTIRDPLGQQHRARAAGAGRDVRRRALRADRAGLLAAGQRVRHAPAGIRADDSPAWCSRPRARCSSARSTDALPRGRRARRVVIGPGVAAGDVRSPICRRRPRAAVDAARDGVNGDTIAKVLFTSGSTGKPKGVINTQRMLCSNQVMIRVALPVPGRRAAGALLLAAVEPHRRRQPQLRHRALQRRHALHRRGQADAAALRHHAAQPARGVRRWRTSPCRAPTRCCCRTCAAIRRCAKRSSAI